MSQPEEVQSSFINNDYYQAFDQEFGGKGIYNYHFALKIITQAAETLGVLLVIAAGAGSLGAFLSDLTITVCEEEEYWYCMIIVGSMVAGGLVLIGSSYATSRLALRLLQKDKEQSFAQAGRDLEEQHYPL